MTGIVVALVVVGIALVAFSWMRKPRGAAEAEPARPEPQLTAAKEAAREAAPEVKEPVVEKPAEASAAEEPAAEEPAVEEPAVEEPVAEEPVAAQAEAAPEVEEEPVAEEEPAVEEPEDDADAIATLAPGGAPVEVPEAFEDDGDDDPILAVARELQAAGELADAADAYESMLLDDPTNPKALEPLVELYTELESWAELQRTLYMLADVADDDQRRIGLMLRAAHVSEERLGDTDGARDRYEQILELDPSSSIARERLDSLNG